MSIDYQSMWLLVLVTLFPVSFSYNADAQEDGEDASNRTYMVEQTEFLTKLFNGYKPDQRPNYRKAPVDVSFFIHIHHLSVPNLPNPTIKFNSLIGTTWSDNRLGWNPADENSKMETSVPSGYSIWVPNIHTFTKGHSARMPIHAYTATRTYLRVSDPNNYQTAKVSRLQRYDGSLDCNSTGSFPWETLTCITRFISFFPLSDVRLSVHDERVIMKTIDMKDIQSDHINGWLLKESRQKVYFYNALNETHPFKTIREDDDKTYIVRHVVECSIVIQRDNWSLAILVLGPTVTTAIMLSVAWMAPILWSTSFFVFILYILSVFVRPSIEKVVIFSDSLWGLDMAVIYLWIVTSFSLFVHLVHIQFQNVCKQRALVLTPFFRRFLIFQRLEQTKAANSLLKDDNLSTEIEVVRIAFGILSFIVFLLVLFV